MRVLVNACRDRLVDAHILHYSLPLRLDPPNVMLTFPLLCDSPVESLSCESNAGPARDNFRQLIQILSTALL